MDQKAWRNPRRRHQPATIKAARFPALGIMGVDFEERVDYRRLHRYRLAIRN